MSAPRVVVAGGHSAGHIEPALAFADALRVLAPQSTITALGTVRGLDTTLIPARGYALELIPPAPFARRASPDLLRVPGRLLAAVRAAGAVLDRVEAQVVVGFGGYVALPAYLAARRRGLPVVVHEANARPGLANRIAARFTGHVFTAGPEIRLRGADPIGIPLRPDIAHLDRAARRATARERFGLPAHGPVLLVTGGSQGAQSINRAVDEALAGLLAAGVHVLHITGPKNAVAQNHVDQVASWSYPGRYVPVAFVDGMGDAYAAADLALCRSGAMTCAELAAVGLPAVFVPLPLRGGEQRLNAEPVVAAGGALLVDNVALNGHWILDDIVPLITDATALATMAARARGTGHADTAIVLARAVLAIVSPAGRKRVNRS